MEARPAVRRIAGLVTAGTGCRCHIDPLVIRMAHGSLPQ
jgi:hypothetical protein